MASWANHRARSRKTYKKRMCAARWFCSGFRQRRGGAMTRFGVDA